MSGRVLNLVVSSISRDAIEVTQFGKEEPDVVAGRTRVEFTTGDNQSFEIDWTWRGDPLPEVGSHWTLRADASGNG